MSKINPDFKINEISTGLARNAANKALDATDDPNIKPIERYRRFYQANKLMDYINPNLLRYLESQLKDIPNVEIHGGHEAVVIKIPKSNENNINNNNYDNYIEIIISPNDYRIKNDEKDYIRNLPYDIIRKLPTIIKKVQSDLRSEKNIFNPPTQKKSDEINNIDSNDNNKKYDTISNDNDKKYDFFRRIFNGKKIKNL